EDNHVITQHADRVVATDMAVDNHAAGHSAELARAEHLAYLCEPDDLLLDLWLEHARHRLFHILDCLVDDAVVADVDTGLLDHVASGIIRTHIETNDASIRRVRQGNVRLGDATDAARDH